MIEMGKSSRHLHETTKQLGLSPVELLHERPPICYSCTINLSIDPRQCSIEMNICDRDGVPIFLQEVVYGLEQRQASDTSSHNSRYSR